MVQTDSSDPSTVVPASRRRPVGFFIVLTLMVIAFAVVVMQRHRIRTQWFVSRLDHVVNPVERLDLLNRISAEMAASEGALAYVARHPSIELRMLAIPHAASSRSREGYRMLASLMTDASQDVREAAALALVFDDSDFAWRILCEAAVRKNPNAASAACSVLGRSRRIEAACVLAKTLREHELAVVRAQAAESLVMLIAGSRQPAMSDVQGWEVRDATLPDACDVYLAIAVATEDGVNFNERLYHEREVLDVMRAAQVNGMAVSEPAESDSLPGVRTIGQLVRRMIHDELGCPFESFAVDLQEFATRLRACVEEARGDDGNPPGPTGG